MHLISIYALYLHFGPIISAGQVKFSADGWELTIDEFINSRTGPKIVEVPESMQVEHSPMHTVRFKGVLRDEVKQMARVNFEQVKVKGTKTGLCAVCGKHATRSETFMSTINPFNKNDDGSVKTRAEVREQALAKQRAWKEEPIVHARCEG